jgi:hypothetical protein
MTHALLEAFNQLAIHDRIDPYFEADIQAYLDDDSQFSLALKRSSQRLSLYGRDHVTIRQKFFNTLPQSARVRVMVSKIRAAGLWSWIEALGYDVRQLTDVQDIGKGRSVYRLVCHNRVVVLKEKINVNQVRYNDLTRQFGRQSYRGWFLTGERGHWELCEWLGDTAGVRGLPSVDMAAQAAAFGDILGVGDRHWDNYIITHNQFVNIDVAHLMAEDNDYWTQVYVCGGLYEVCVLKDYLHDTRQLDGVARSFFSTYYAYAMYLRDRCQQIGQVIGHKWHNKHAIVNHIRTIYVPALGVMFERMVYKSIVQQLVAQGVDITNHPVVYMYYLADKGGWSVFFRAEAVMSDIIAVITQLARDHLGISAQYFVDYKATVDAAMATIARACDESLAKPLSATAIFAQTAPDSVAATSRL